MTDPAWIISTDLDASLLDGNYVWDGAESALKLITEAGIPLILNSSKTLSEMHFYSQALGLSAPLIAENGTVIAFPEAMKWMPDSLDFEDGYGVLRSSMNRTKILKLAHGLRDSKGYDFIGFDDSTAEELADRLGLEIEPAKAALKRYGTEPIVWKDSDAALIAFKEALEAEGITLIRGGHFHHLMPVGASKGAAMQSIREFYQKEHSEFTWKTLAIGDSPNDVSMLELADEALVIPNPNNGTLRLRRSDYTIADASGPAGWGDAVIKLLNAFLCPI
jgi:mannosyl-3-phosphoglycerate phosphatase